MRLAADRDDVGHAVAIEVTTAEVLRGDGGVDDGLGPGSRPTRSNIKTLVVTIAPKAG